MTYGLPWPRMTRLFTFHHSWSTSSPRSSRVPRTVNPQDIAWPRSNGFIRGCTWWPATCFLDRKLKSFELFQPESGENESGRASCDSLIKWYATPLNASWPTPFFPERCVPYTYNPIEKLSTQSVFEDPEAIERSALLCKENIRWKGNKFNYAAAQRFRPGGNNPSADAASTSTTSDKTKNRIIQETDPPLIPAAAKVSQRTNPYLI